MIPSSTIVDLSGPQRVRYVRVIDGVVYGERKTHPNGWPVTHAPDIVHVLDADGSPLVIADAFEETKPRRQWRAGEWTAAKNGQCSCGGRGRALRSFTPE